MKSKVPISTAVLGMPRCPGVFPYWVKGGFRWSFNRNKSYRWMRRETNMKFQGPDLRNRFANLSINADGGHQVTAFGEDIETEVYERCMKFNRDTVYLQGFVANYISLFNDHQIFGEIEQGLLSTRYNAPSLIHSAMVGTMLAQAEAQRKTSNLLCSAGAFRDRSPGRLFSKFGKQSPEFLDFKACIKQQYDNKFEYRLMYNLRNFAAHENAPISLIPMKYETDNKSSASLEVRVLLSKSDLLKSSDVQKSFKSELVATEDDTFDLKELADVYFICHEKMLAHLIDRFMPSIQDGYEYVSSIFASSNPPPNSSQAIINAKKSGPGDLDMKVLFLPFEMVDFFVSLRGEF